MASFMDRAPASRVGKSRRSLASRDEEKSRAAGRVGRSRRVRQLDVTDEKVYAWCPRSMRVRSGKQSLIQQRRCHMDGGPALRGR